MLVFSVEMLPARQGDCLWIEYGDPDQSHVILVDGGMTETAAAIQQKIRNRSTGKRLRIELIVVTHIDTDHILGIPELLKDPNLDLEIGDVWFNGRPQLEKAFPDLLGTVQGDELSELLGRRKYPWNAIFGGELVVFDNVKPPRKVLDGGLCLTVIGPPRERLAALAKTWIAVKGGTDSAETDGLGKEDDILGRNDVWPAQWKEVKAFDTAVANGSSIALIAEFEGKRLLLSGDAFAPDLIDGLAQYRAHYASNETGGLPFAAVKLSHHGSVKNISKDLLDAINCRRYLVSTDGTQHKHPDTQALLRVIRWGGGIPTFHFNYRKERTDWWIDRGGELPSEFQLYEKAHPSVDRNGWLKVVL
ncbi:Metallo-beta-lactamase superfamily protein [Rhodospirillales bacterium URHD0017]|nr:Metallo-beta-lactamase superfamily protein [Rhodospirillales bacterium URHD0017]